MVWGAGTLEKGDGGVFVCLPEDILVDRCPPTIVPCVRITADHHLSDRLVELPRLVQQAAGFWRGPVQTKDLKRAI